MNTEQRAYNCTQSELYTICRIAWNKYKDDLPDFAEFRGFYKPNLYDTRMAEIKAAASLDDLQARDEASESHRIDLSTLAGTCLLRWRSLARYIEHAYPNDQVKPKMEAAGKAYLDEASHNNWKALNSLNTSGLNYLSKHKAELLLNENMPENFEERYINDVKVYDVTFAAYISTGEDISKGTNTKIKANNQLYKDLRAMLSDAQVIYTGNRTKSSTYVFEYLKSIITQPTSSMSKDTADGGNVTPQQ